MHRFIYIAILFFCVIGCKTAQEPYNKRIISDTIYKEHFYITDEEPKAKKDRAYYWYRAQKVHHSQGDYAGELVDGLYIKYYQSNQLAAKGYFKEGVKDGLWKNWYKNGQLSNEQTWKAGKLHGKTILRDSLGHIQAIGKYKKGKKSGKWIYPTQQDTISYKKGEEIEPKLKKEKDSTKQSFFKRVFKKKKTTKKKQQTKKKKKKPSKIGLFFKKLFAKKKK